jgi:hypothetical protein
MRRSVALAITPMLAVTVCCAQAVGARASVAVMASARAASGSWGKAQVLPGPGGVPFAPIYAMSCASAGNCGAGGSYSVGTTEQAYVVDQTDGTWGKAEEVPGTAKLNTGGLAIVGAVSCASAGNCSAGGEYAVSNPNDEQAFVVNETDGTWGKAEEVPGTATLNAGDEAQVFSVSCASAGKCSGGGIYLNASGSDQAFIVNETDGTWGKAEEVPGTGALNTGGNAAIESVSCRSAGSCSAVGNYSDTAGRGEDQAFVVGEKDGIWGKAVAVPGMSTLNEDGIAYVNSVSCGSTGNCSAIGTEWNGNTNVDQAFVVTEANGTWGKAAQVPGVTALSKEVLSYADPQDCYDGNCMVMSCPSAGNCTATGAYETSQSVTEVFVVTEADGKWGKAQEVPGIAALNVGETAQTYAVSCGSPGNCSVGGYYSSSTSHVGDTEAFLVNQTNGSWGKAEEVPGIAALNTGDDALVYALSCASAGNCSAGGAYSGGGFVTSQGAT